MLAQRHLLLLALIAVPLHAAEVTVTSAETLQPRVVTAVARRIDRAADPITTQITIPGTSAIAVGDGIWEIGIDGDALWAPRVFMREADAISIPVWTAAPIHVDAKVESLDIAFAPLETNGARGETTCRKDETGWTCIVPRGRYDLRFSSRGAAPEYRFASTVPHDGTIALQFVAGASLSGSLDGPRGVALEGVELTLTAPASPQRFTTRSNERGFFQFKGLPPGEYALRAKRQGLTAQARSVKIIAGLAAELSAPLVLDSPKQLSVTIAPPLDPDLQPWRVSLWSADAAHRLSSVSEYAASPDGTWSFAGLVGGEYRVEISRANGQRWKSEDVTITNADIALPLAVLGEHVTGSITLGDRPIAAAVSFGGEGGVTLRAGADGQFEGDIPPADGDERTIYVDAEDVQVVRTVRVRRDDTNHIAIALPATTLIGRVIDAEGSPRANAIVTCAGARSVQQSFSKSDGSFQLTGLDAGEYRVSAETAEEKSETAKATLAIDAPAEVELVLQNQVVVRGQVAAQRAPVVQADAYAIPRDTAWAPFMPHATTTDLGRFELDLPPHTGTYDLVVIHPAFDVALSRVLARRDEVLHVVATQIGGTLVAESRSPNDLLLHHGGGECWASWLAARAGGSVDAEHVALPRLEPGQYSICSATTKHCASGYLPPLGQLTLTVD